ncbi:MAG: RNB domain-containing ribonuclease [Desulfarculus sp.]|jgi:exoribonuclease-2|nr:MAG: RNB domain-containing ribonuclease [Desulfarculus sp.]
MHDPVGHLVEFIEKGKVAMGLVQAAKKGRLNLLTAGGRQAALSQGRVLLMTPAAMGPDSPRNALLEYMHASEARREELADRVNVAELWDLVHEETEPLPLKDLAELCFGRGAGDDQLSATLRALFNEGMHFRLAGGQFLPLSQDQLEAKRLQQEREDERRGQVEAGVAFLRGLPPEGPAPEPPPELAAILANLLVLEDEAPQAKLAKDILSQAELGGRRRLFELLVRLGVFRPHENLQLRREGLAKEFTPQVLELAAILDPAAALDNRRQDLTGLYTFTIDGSFTTDFDDALSFEPAPDGGGTIGVHITDAGALLTSGDPLDQEAMSRGSSIYLPDDRIPMLPPALSEDRLSLKQGALRPALSCLACLDSEGRLLDYSLQRSLLRVDRRLTYDETDGLLEVDPRLAGLHRLCQAFKAQRGQAGAYFLPLPEVLVGVDPASGQVWVRRVDKDGPSREMVAETAILANWLFARYLAEQGVPALYRTQAQPSEPIEEGDPGDIYLHFKQRRLLNRVEITTTPGLHSSLGVQPYTHATSPIRRYLDLVMQRQLARVLAGQPPLYSAAQLDELAMQVGPVVRQGGKVRQARQRYWLLKWLEERTGQTLPGVVMERQMRRWQLLLTDIMLLCTVPSQGAPSLAPGQEVGILIERVDAFEDVLRVRLA